MNINKKDTNTSVKDKSTSCFSFLPISVDNWYSFISFKLVEQEHLENMGLSSEINL